MPSYVGGIYRQGRLGLDADLGKDAVVEIVVRAGVSVRRYVDVGMLCLGSPLDIALLFDKLVVTLLLSDLVLEFRHEVVVESPRLKRPTIASDRHSLQA